jgi:hypothetical protein
MMTGLLVRKTHDVIAMTVHIYVMGELDLIFVRLVQHVTLTLRRIQIPKRK